MKKIRCIIMNLQQITFYHFPRQSLLRIILYQFKKKRLLSESTGVSFQKKLFTLSSTQESNTRLLLTEHNKPELVTQYVISEFSPWPQATSQNVLFLCSPKRAARPLITSVFETCKKIMFPLIHRQLNLTTQAKCCLFRQIFCHHQHLTNADGL